MNQNTFRLIFDPRRAMQVPVAENLPSPTHSGTTSGKVQTVDRPNKTNLALRFLACAVALAWGSVAWSNPLAPQVVNGTASFATSANTLTIANSPNAIINWQSFSINPGETTHFLQQSANSVVLNRVTGVDPSRLLGQLSSNGKVFLINPAGILVGPGARIDVNGLLASTLPLSNQDFLAGKLQFRADPGGAGTVVNQGAIRTPQGGQVYLLGSNVSNEGLISSPQGEVILAAGESVSILDSGTPNVSVQVTGATDNVTNLGAVVAESGRIGILAAAIKQQGTLNANGVQATGGRIWLKATQQIELGESSSIQADGTQGGEVLARVENNGQVSGSLIGQGQITARGDGQTGSGGFVDTSAAEVRLGDLRVDTRGGAWLIDPTDFTISAGSAAQISSGVGATTLANNLDSNNITISTSAAGTQAGNINLNAPLSVNSVYTSSLTLEAHNNINLNADVTATGSGPVSLILRPDFDKSGGGAVVVGAGNNVTFDLNGGTVTLQNGLWNNQGTVNLLNSSALVIESTNSGAPATFNNNGTVWMNSTEQYPISGSANRVGGAEKFNNAGILNWNQEWGGASGINGLTFNNSGVVNITSNSAGLIVNNSTGTDTGTYNINDSVDGLQFTSGSRTFSGPAQFRGSGSLTFGAGTFTFAQNMSTYSGSSTSYTADSNVGSSSPLSLDTTPVTAPKNGTVSIDATNGTVTYTPNANFVGTDTFTYRFADSSTHTAASYHNVTVTVSVQSNTVTIVAASAEKVYGNADPALTYSITNPGNVGLTGSLTRATGENVGTYTIDQGSLACTSTCQLIFSPGTFTITRRPQSTWIGGSGNWSDPAHWDAVPTLANVAAVSIPNNVTVNYDLNGVLLDQLNSAGTLSFGPGNTLNVAGTFNTFGYAQSGGTVSANDFTASSLYDQSGGTLEVLGTANLQQLTGDMHVANLTAASATLLSSGAVLGNGLITAPTLYVTGASIGTSTSPLMTHASQVSFTANNGSAYITNNSHALGLSSAPVNVSGKASGDAIFVNYGETNVPYNTTYEGVSAVTITANSPLNINGSVISEGPVVLTAAAPGDLTINGSITGNPIYLFAPGGTITGNIPVSTSAANSIDATTQSVADTLNDASNTTAPPPTVLPILPPPTPTVLDNNPEVILYNLMELDSKAALELLERQESYLSESQKNTLLQQSLENQDESKKPAYCGC